MLDDILEEIRRKMLEAEGEVYDKLSDYSLEVLVDFYHSVNEDVLDNAKCLEHIVKSEHRKYGQEAIFSTFRILKAILAEIEYRIKENKI